MLKAEIQEKRGQEFDSGRLLMWVDRMAAVRKIYARRAAEYLLEWVIDELPNDKDLEMLRELLVVRDVSGPDPDEAYVSAVVAKTTDVKRTVGQLQEMNALIVVGRPNPRMQPPPEGVLILRQYNAWTPDTLPYIPPRSEARMTFRLTSPTLVQQTRDARVADLREVVKLLERSGVSLPDKDELLRGTAYASDAVKTDLATASLQAEFGIGRVYSPHWRPAIKRLMGQFTPRFFQYENVWRTLVDEKYTAWKQVVNTIPRIKERRAEEVRTFQAKLLR